MWVVKLGGSLAASTYLGPWLAALTGRRDLVLVPGGGPFADQVRAAQRDLGFDDATGHHLALLAMEQYGRVLCALEPGLAPATRLTEMRDLATAGITPVWMPVPLALADPHLPRTWDLTSDSLAAWLAGRLAAPALVLVKVAHLRPGPVTLEALIREGLVDPLLATYARAGEMAVYLLSATDAGALNDLIAGRPGPAVVVRV